MLTGSTRITTSQAPQPRFEGLSEGLQAATGTPFAGCVSTTDERLRPLAGARAGADAKRRGENAGAAPQLVGGAPAGGAAFRGVCVLDRPRGHSCRPCGRAGLRRGGRSVPGPGLIARPGDLFLNK